MMDLSPFIRFSEKDRLPNTPHLSLTIRATIELALTLPYPIHFTLRRLARGDSTDAQPCTIRFNPAIDPFLPPEQGGLVLLRHHARGGPEAIPVDGPAVVVPDEEGEGEEGNQFLWELAAPGDEVTLRAMLPERYYRARMEGWGDEHMLVYPGAEVEAWGWGTGGGAAAAGEEKPVPVVVPGGARICFVVVGHSSDLEGPWPERAAYEAEYGFERANAAQLAWHEREKAAKPRYYTPPPPVEPSDRVSGAPHFTVAAEGSATVRSYDRIWVTLIFTYHGVTGANGSFQTSTARPVTFHSRVLASSNHFNMQLARRRAGSEGGWEACELYDSGVTGFIIYDDDDDWEVYVGQRGEDFASLLPGESWTTGDCLHEWPDIALPRDSMTGDVFRYRVIRAGTDWWDWGSMEDHRETMVKLPRWAGDVTDPKDNGGRPRLVVPASEWFEFTLLE